MSATVGDLLDRFHALAVDLPGTGEAVQTETAMLASGWSALAPRLAGALDALPFDADGPGGRQRDAHVAMLRALVSPQRQRATPADAALGEVAMVVGAIGDLLVAHRPAFQVSVPAKWFFTNAKVYPPVYQWRDQNEAGASGLEASLLAGAFVVADWTLHRLKLHGTASTAFGHALERILWLSEPYGRTDPGQRGSSLEHVTAIPAGELSLLGALARWADRAEPALHRRLVTSGTFAMLASDLTLLTAAASRALAADEEVRQGVKQVGLPQAFAQAHAGWKQLAAWPADLRLGGPRATDLIAASRELRSYLRADFGSPEGRLSGPELVARFTPDHLQTVAHEIAHRVAWVGDALAKTVRDQSIGQGRLWLTPDEGKTLDPRLVPPVRWIPQPDGAPAVVVPADWLILRQPTPKAVELGDVAKQAARHAKRAAQLLEDHLNGAGPLVETVASVTLTRQRIHTRLGPVVAPQRRAPER